MEILIEQVPPLRDLILSLYARGLLSRGEAFRRLLYLFRAVGYPYSKAETLSLHWLAATKMMGNT